MAANDAVTYDYSCAYCFQKLPYMNEPRELPCSHVFCLPCLQADLEEIKNMECNICGRAYDIDDLSSLPSPELNSAEATEITDENQRCDVCTETHRDATSFCSDCDKRMCDEHVKSHDQSKAALRTFSNGDHDTVPITDMKRAMRAQPVFCSDHGDEVLMLACGLCHRMFCFLCKTDSPCTNTQGLSVSHHAIVRLDRLADELRDKQKASMKTLSEKITDVCKMEKSGWRMLDGVETKTKEMSQEVDRAAEEQISEIRRLAVNKKEELKRNLSTSTNQVEDYTTQLMLVKEKMQELWKVLHAHAKGSDVELLMSQKDDSQLVSDLLKVQIPALLGQLPVSSGSVCKASMLLACASAAPTFLETVKVLPYSKCNCVTWNCQGKLLAGQGSSVALFDEALTELKSKTVHRQLMSMVDVGESPEQQFNYFVWIYENVVASFDYSYKHSIDARLNQYSSELELKTRIDSYSSNLIGGEAFPDSFVRLLAVNSVKSHVLVLYPSKLDVLSMQGNVQYAIRLESMTSPRGIQAASDGGLLIANTQRLYKYRYQKPPLPTELIWQSDPIKNLHGISSDPTGYIYVGCTGGVQVLSPSGKLLEMMPHQHLRSVTISDLCVSKSGGQMAVACGADGLKLFNISRKQLV